MEAGQDHSAPAWRPAAWHTEVRLGGWRGQRMLAVGGRHSEAGMKPLLNRAGRCHCQSFSFMTKASGRRVRLGWLMVGARPATWTAWPSARSSNAPTCINRGAATASARHQSGARGSRPAPRTPTQQEARGWGAWWRHTVPIGGVWGSGKRWISAYHGGLTLVVKKQYS